MSSFSLVISPPDGSRPGFIERTYACATASLLERSILRKSLDAVEKAKSYVTLRSATMPCGILSFGSWLEPRYIFAAGQLD
jgi:hypothetical protein